MGEREGSQSRGGGLDVVDGRIANRLWESRSRSSVLTQKRLEVLPQPPRHWTRGGLQRRTVGNWSRTPRVGQEKSRTARKWSDEDGYFQRLPGSHPMDGAPGAWVRAATSQVDQLQRKNLSQSRDRNRDPLGSRTHRHPRE